MRSARLGGFLLGLGAAVGVAAVVGLVTGFEPSRLPPALLDIAAYKLTMLAAVGLLTGGAIVRRRGLRQERRAEDASSEDASRTAAVSAAPASAPLPPAPLDADPSRRVEHRPKDEARRDR